MKGGVISDLDPLLGVFDSFVTEELGGNEALDAVVQSGPNTNGLSWTRAAVKVIPHLKHRHRAQDDEVQTSGSTVD